MTPTQKRNHIELIKGAIEDKGFTVDKYGNHKITIKDVTLRIKFMKINIRIERKVGRSWNKIASVPVVKTTIGAVTRLVDRYTLVLEKI